MCREAHRPLAIDEPSKLDRVATENQKPHIDISGRPVWPLPWAFPWRKAGRIVTDDGPGRIAVATFGLPRGRRSISGSAAIGYGIQQIGDVGGEFRGGYVGSSSGSMGSRKSESSRLLVRATVIAGTCLLLANCGSGKFASRVDPKYGVSSSPRVVGFGEVVPKGGGTYRVGKPYTVAGRTYVPEEDTHYRAEGMASWYGDAFHGRLTANGEVFDMTSLTAAHPTLPMPSYVRVTNLRNGKSLIVRVNDRGPYHGNRVIDVSNRAAKLLEFQHNGVARVRVEYVGRAPLEGSDDRQLVATLRTGEPAPAPSAIRVASAATFVPEFRSSRNTLSGNVPIPSDRPYSLGSTSEDMASSTATELSARGARPHRAGFGMAAADAPDNAATPAYRPVSAYAPVRRDDAAAVLGGRGLY